MVLSSELEPTLITVLSSSLRHMHTAAAKSLAELLQEQPQSDRHVVDQLLKEYGMLYKVGVVGAGSLLLPLHLSSLNVAGHFSHL